MNTVRLLDNLYGTSVGPTDLNREGRRGPANGFLRTPKRQTKARIECDLNAE